MNNKSLYCSNQNETNVQLYNQGYSGKFKEDIINALNQIEDKLNNRVNSIESQLKIQNEIIYSRIEQMESLMTKLSKDINNISHKTANNEEAISLQKKGNELSITNNININTLSKELSSACNKYDKIFLDNLILPGEIGEFCKFKNVKECLDYVLTQLIQFNSFKEKVVIELQFFQEKTENIIKNGVGQIDIMRKNNITNATLGIIEDKLNNKIDQFKEDISDVKFENNKYAIASKEITQTLQSEIILMKQLKESITEENSKILKEFNDNMATTNGHYQSLKGSFNKINRQFFELSGFIKDVRFKKNINAEVTKRDIQNITNTLIGDEMSSTHPLNQSFNELTFHNIKINEEPKDKLQTTVETDSNSFEPLPKGKRSHIKSIKKKKIRGTQAKNSVNSINIHERKSKSQGKKVGLLLNENLPLIKHKDSTNKSKEKTIKNMASIKEENSLTKINNAKLYNIPSNSNYNKSIQINKRKE